MTFTWGRVLLAAGGGYCLCVAAPAAAAQSLGGGEALGVSLWRIVASLMICLMVAALAILAIRQRGGKISLPAWFAKMDFKSRAVQVVESRRLSQHADICLVRYGGREYLLLLMAGAAQVLREGDAPVPQFADPAE